MSESQNLRSGAETVLGNCRERLRAAISGRPPASAFLIRNLRACAGNGVLFD